ncbi:cytochrome d ubiquinol oxidase subunit II [Marinoscillum furvescens]|uniref:Cytochrome bd-I ubiquinol oxidase subunit 2 apoprotein n=1 Tax=Marinoscillum furvescens DSM 4134 TaxID=1122208 RepID=A0A3D9L1A8_MARFU|nr:cytochrome d ubiquinol oxidase subunit II [Marinoscillum furvescens]RED96608.1 cytochrome bd-I ubiquinol oxidase subunit 2 apoprotein [Marinoscillum furvescens DSM 4134]
METFLGVDYATLWFLVIGGLFTGYAILDGFDLGAGAWHLFLNTEKDRRIALNAIGPVWDGNEVWLVIAGGALFAGFPVVYATVFSAMYVPFMLFLTSLIFRAISIEFRSKEPMRWWRQSWDVAYSLSSVLLALLLGIVLGNVLQGMPIGENFEYVGNWLEFLNPYAFMVGVCTLGLFMMHGAIYLIMKTEGRLFLHLSALVQKAIIFFIVSFVITSVYTLIYFPHLSDRFKESPALFAVPLAAFLSIANIPRLITKKKYGLSFVFSSITVSMLLIMVAIELYPAIIMSTFDAAYTITVHNGSASEKTLGIMLLMAAIGAPLVAFYTGFVYKTFRGKVQMDENSY